MKTERITLLGSRKFKAFLAAQAKQSGLSVSELVRRRCAGWPTEEMLLKSLTQELQCAVKEANHALSDGITAVNEALEEIRAIRLKKEKKAKIESN